MNVRENNGCLTNEANEIYKELKAVLEPFFNKCIEKGWGVDQILYIIMIEYSDLGLTYLINEMVEHNIE